MVSFNHGLKPCLLQRGASQLSDSFSNTFHHQKFSESEKINSHRPPTQPRTFTAHQAASTYFRPKNKRWSISFSPDPIPHRYHDITPPFHSSSSSYRNLLEHLVPYHAANTLTFINPTKNQNISVSTMWGILGKVGRSTRDTIMPVPYRMQVRTWDAASVRVSWWDMQVMAQVGGARNAKCEFCG